MKGCSGEEKKNVTLLMHSTIQSRKFNPARLFFFFTVLKVCSRETHTVQLAAEGIKR